ncbi:hypothetical protein [Vibrio sp. AND4]|nr:hypothetical protein [Vibrio sp. AND4]EDP58198.1 hypothetical protein AND4_16100 [Vibrio sp. AND4]
MNQSGIESFHECSLAEETALLAQGEEVSMHLALNRVNVMEQKVA